MYQFDLLKKDEVVDLDDVSNEGLDVDNNSDAEDIVNDDDLQVIMHECQVGVKEFTDAMDEYKEFIHSFRELQEVKASVESFGIDDRLIAQVKDELDNIAPSFKQKDVEATLSEIELANEGILEYIKEKASDLKAKWKNGWIKNMKADIKIRQRLQKATDMVAKLEDGDLPSKRVVAYDYSTADVTLPKIEAILKEAVAMPVKKGDTSLWELWNAAQMKLVQSYNLDDPKCVMTYVSSDHVYTPDESQDPEVMPLPETGVTTNKDLLSYADKILKSSFGNQAVGNLFDQQYEELIKTLRQLPMGETQTAYELYDWSVAALYTAFINGEGILRQYAVQTLIALQGIK